MTTTPNELPIAVRHIIASTVYDHGIDGHGIQHPQPDVYTTSCGLRWAHELPRPIPTAGPRTCKTCAEHAAPGSVYLVVGHTAAELENLPTIDTTDEK